MVTEDGRLLGHHRDGYENGRQAVEDLLERLPQLVGVMLARAVPAAARLPRVGCGLPENLVPSFFA